RPDQSRGLTRLSWMDLTSRFRRARLPSNPTNCCTPDQRRRAHPDPAIRASVLLGRVHSDRRSVVAGGRALARGPSARLRAVELLGDRPTAGIRPDVRAADPGQRMTTVACREGAALPWCYEPRSPDAHRRSPRQV